MSFLLQICHIFIASTERFKCTANNHRELNFFHTFLPFYQSGNARGKYLTMRHRFFHTDVSQLIFWTGQSLFSIFQSLTHPVKLSTWMLVGAIGIGSFFSFWKSDYFSDMTLLKSHLSHVISCSSQTQPITSDISLRYLSQTSTQDISTEQWLHSNWRNSN